MSDTVVATKYRVRQNKERAKNKQRSWFIEWDMRPPTSEDDGTECHGYYPNATEATSAVLNSLH